MDEYILQILDNSGYNYYKNGKLHREDGPACFSIYNRIYESFLNLDDKDLYKEVHVTSPPNSNRIIYSPVAQYYLEDCRYRKDEFEKLVKIIKLHKQLDIEIPIGQKTTKLTKV